MHDVRDADRTTGCEDVFTKIETCRRHDVDCGIGREYVNRFVR